MKKLLSLLAAVGMTATTSATAATVVSCGDKGGEEDKGPEISAEDKYAEQKQIFKSDAMDVINSYLNKSEFTTSSYGTIKDGKAKNIRFFGTDIDDKKYTELLKTLQTKQNGAKEDPFLVEKINEVFAIDKLNEDISEMAYKGINDSYPELFSGMSKDEIKTDSNLKISNIEFTKQESNSKSVFEDVSGSDEVENGIVSITVEIEVSIIAKSSTGDVEPLKITENKIERTGSIISNELKEHMEAIEAFSNLLANPYGYKASNDKASNDKVKSIYQSNFISTLTDKDVFNFKNFGYDWIDPTRGENNKLQDITNGLKALADEVASKYKLTISSTSGTKIAIGGNVDYYFKSIDDLSRINFDTIKGVDINNPLKYVHNNLVTGDEFGMFSNILASKSPEEGKYSKEWNKKIESNSVIKNSIAHQTIKGTFNVKTSDNEHELNLDIPFIITIGGSVDKESNSLTKSFETLDQLWSKRWKNLTTGVIAAEQDETALFTFEKDDKVKSDYLKRLSDKWSEKKGDRKNWISTAMKAAGNVNNIGTIKDGTAKMYFDNPYWTSPSVIEVEKDENGYKNSKNTALGYWDNIVLTIDKFTWNIGIENSSNIQKLVRSKDFYTIKFAK